MVLSFSMYGAESEKQLFLLGDSWHLEQCIQEKHQALEKLNQAGKKSRAEWGKNFSLMLGAQGHAKEQQKIIEKLDQCLVQEKTLLKQEQAQEDAGRSSFLEGLKNAWIKFKDRWFGKSLIFDYNKDLSLLERYEAVRHYIRKSCHEPNFYETHHLLQNDGSLSSKAVSAFLTEAFAKEALLGKDAFSNLPWQERLVALNKKIGQLKQMVERLFDYSKTVYDYAISQKGSSFVDMMGLAEIPHDRKILATLFQQFKFPSVSNLSKDVQEEWNFLVEKYTIKHFFPGGEGATWAARQKIKNFLDGIVHLREESQTLENADLIAQRAKLKQYVVEQFPIAGFSDEQKMTMTRKLQQGLKAVSIPSQKTYDLVEKYMIEEEKRCEKSLQQDLKKQYLEPEIPWRLKQFHQGFFNHEIIRALPDIG